MPHLLFNGCVQFVKQVSSAASLACLTQSPCPPCCVAYFRCRRSWTRGLKEIVVVSARPPTRERSILVEYRFGGEGFLNPQDICTKRGRSACVRSGICPLSSLSSSSPPMSSPENAEMLAFAVGLFPSMEDLANYPFFSLSSVLPS